MADNAKIAAEEIEVVDIHSIELHKHNPRLGDIAAIMMSLDRFGQQKPIVVDAEGTVVAGNHTLMAALKLGWKTISITRTGIEGDDSIAYLLADNRTADRARNKSTELAELVQEQFDLGNLEGTSYDIDDVEDLRAEGRLGEEEGPDVDELGRIPHHKDGTEGGEGEGKREPIREVVMMMPQSAAIDFGMQVAALQKHYGTHTVVDTVRRAVADMAEQVVSGDTDEFVDTGADTGADAEEPVEDGGKKKKGAESKQEIQQRLAQAAREREAAKSA